MDRKSALARIEYLKASLWENSRRYYVDNAPVISDYEYDMMMRELSDLEKDVLVRYMEGKSYVEIAGEMNRHVKSIDNALQRIKRKLLKYLEEK